MTARMDRKNVWKCKRLLQVVKSETRILVASTRDVETMAELAISGMDTFTFSSTVARQLFVDQLFADGCRKRIQRTITTRDSTRLVLSSEIIDGWWAKWYQLLQRTSMSAISEARLVRKQEALGSSKAPGVKMVAILLRSILLEIAKLARYTANEEGRVYCQPKAYVKRGVDNNVWV